MSTRSLLLRRPRRGLFKPAKPTSTKSKKPFPWQQTSPLPCFFRAERLVNLPLIFSIIIIYEHSQANHASTRRQHQLPAKGRICWRALYFAKLEWAGHREYIQMGKAVRMEGGAGINHTGTWLGHSIGLAWRKDSADGFACWEQRALGFNLRAWAPVY